MSLVLGSHCEDNNCKAPWNNKNVKKVILIIGARGEIIGKNEKDGHQL